MRIVPRRGIFIVRKTKAEILEMITVWAALESMAARLATKEASDEELASLHDLVDSFSTDKVAAKMGEYSDANIRFHQAIIGLGKCALHRRDDRQRCSSTSAPSASARSSRRIAPGARSSITRRSSPRSRRATPSAPSGWCASTRCKLRDHVERFVDID